MKIKQVLNFTKWAIFIFTIVPILLYFLGFAGVFNKENQKLAALQFSVPSANIVQITADERGIPFFLDDAGHVWAFLIPFTANGPKDPVQLPKLEHIKKIEPYIALDDKGQVFTWSLDETLVLTTEGDINSVGYTTPRKIPALTGVTQISYSNYYFFAVKMDQEIVMWQRLHGNNKLGEENMYEFSQDGPIRTLYSGDKIKMIASTNENTRLITMSQAMPFGLVALLEDGTVRGWGITESGQIKRKADTQGIVLTQSPGATQVAINAFHTIVLNAQGVPQFWGGCDMYGLDKRAKPWQFGHLNGEIGFVDNILDLTVAKEISPISSHIPGIFIKRDGSVWVSYAPPLKNTPTEACRDYQDHRIDYLKPKKIQIGENGAVQVAAGDDMVLILDANHQIWRFNLRYDDKSANEYKAKEMNLSLRTAIGVESPNR